MTYEQATSNEMSKAKLTNQIKKVAFKELLQQQSTHKKVKTIIYKEFKIQPYLQSELLTTKKIICLQL